MYTAMCMLIITPYKLRTFYSLCKRNEEGGGGFFVGRVVSVLLTKTVLSITNTADARGYTITGCIQINTVEIKYITFRDNRPRDVHGDDLSIRHAL
jgi:hypothetical protein